MAAGAQIELAGGTIVEQCSGGFIVKSAHVAFLGAGNANPPGVQLPSTELATDERFILLDARTFQPARNRRYMARHADGTTIEGLSDDQGRTDILRSKSIGEIDFTIYPDEAAE